MTEQLYRRKAQLVKSTEAAVFVVNKTADNIPLQLIHHFQPSDEDPALKKFVGSQKRT